MVPASHMLPRTPGSARGGCWGPSRRWMYFVGVSPAQGLLAPVPREDELGAGLGGYPQPELLLPWFSSPYLPHLLRPPQRPARLRVSGGSGIPGLSGSRDRSPPVAAYGGDAGEGARLCARVERMRWRGSEEEGVAGGAMGPVGAPPGISGWRRRAEGNLKSSPGGRMNEEPRKRLPRSLRAHELAGAPARVRECWGNRGSWAPLLGRPVAARGPCCPPTLHRDAGGVDNGRLPAAGGWKYAPGTGGFGDRGSFGVWGLRLALLPASCWPRPLRSFSVSTVGEF